MKLLSLVTLTSSSVLRNSLGLENKYGLVNEIWASWESFGSRMEFIGPS